MRKKAITVAAAAASILAWILGRQAPASAAVTAHSEMTAHGVGAARAAGPSSGGTTVTFTVNTGTLSIEVPAAADLGTVNVGATGAATPIGTVTVTDSRAGSGLNWTVTVTSDGLSLTTDSTQAIPASAITYASGDFTPTGTVTLSSAVTFPLSSSSQTVVTGNGIVGGNTATWNPSLTATMPPTAVLGSYTGTLTHSVA
jgi:hypothetical protein